MQMHELTTQKTARKRVGRGGKYRKTAGRGTKGQKSRSGGNVDPLFEGGRSSLLQRMKKLRGFTSPHPRKCTVTLGALNRAFSDGETVTVEELVSRGVIRASQAGRGVKIVVRGTLNKTLTLSDDIAASAAARAALSGSATTPASTDTPTDDLTKIEGIGPKIAQTLADAGITTFAALADADTDTIEQIISSVRGSHSPATWSKLAALARDGKWEELSAWQEELVSGKEA